MLSPDGAPFVFLNCGWYVPRTLSWVRIQLADQTFLGFAYTDRSAGASAKGAIVREGSLAADVQRAVEQPDRTVRLGPGFVVQPLTALAIAELGLPAAPPWLALFGGAEAALALGAPVAPQINAPWRSDPALGGFFHESYPDDLQVRFYFVAEHQVEGMWVRVVAVDDEIRGYAGVLLNTPKSRSEGIAQNASVSLRVAPGAGPPIWVSAEMRANLREWTSVCGSCGFDMVLEPMSELARRQFPNAPAGAVPVMFTTRCAMCGQTMTVEHRNAPR